MLHYKTSFSLSDRSARREAAETICLLDAIMGGLENESSGALRDLCARASADFLKWSAKHIPRGKGKKKKMAVNLKCNLCSDYPVIKC